MAIAGKLTLGGAEFCQPCASHFRGYAMNPFCSKALLKEEVD